MAKWQGSGRKQSWTNESVGIQVFAWRKLRTTTKDVLQHTRCHDTDLDREHPHYKKRYRQISSALRSSLFRIVMKRALVIVHRRFGTAYRPHLQGSSSPRQRHKWVSMGTAFYSEIFRCCRNIIIQPAVLWIDLASWDAHNISNS
jgi:hypothetical protein